MKDRLIELIKDLAPDMVAKCGDACDTCKHGDCVGKLADHLLEGGVIVQAQGEWKKVRELYPRYACTCCNHLYNNRFYKYCPFCGAKMYVKRSNENAE